MWQYYSALLWMNLDSFRDVADVLAPRLTFAFCWHGTQPLCKQLYALSFNRDHFLPRGPTCCLVESVFQGNRLHVKVWLKHKLHNFKPCYFCVSFECLVWTSDCHRNLLRLYVIHTVLKSKYVQQISIKWHTSPRGIPFEIAILIMWHFVLQQHQWFVGM